MTKTTFRIVDITTGRTCGTVEANTPRGALIIAKRTIVNPNGFYAARPVEGEHWYNGMFTAPIDDNTGVVSGSDLAIWACGGLARMTVEGQTTLWEKVSA